MEASAKLQSEASASGDQYHLPSARGEEEHGRLDIQHRVWGLSLNGQLHAAPIPSDIASALDVGCGTAAWTLAFAAAHPNCRVFGTDLDPPHVPDAPPNCTFVAANAEEPWHLAGSPFDFVNARLLTLGIKDWPRFYAECWANLSPGGWLEIGGMSDSICSASGATMETSPLLVWDDAWRRGLAAAGIDLARSTCHTADLEAQGFAMVEERVLYWPLGAWQTSARQQEMGALMMENCLKVPRAPPVLKVVGLAVGGEEEARKITEEGMKDLRENWLERRFYSRMTVHVAQKPCDAHM